MRTIFATLLGLLISTTFIAQKGLRGEVISDEGTPVKRAIIRVANTNFSTFTNDQGEFQLTDLSSGKYDLQISALGYDSFSKEIQVVDIKAPVQHFVLKAIERSMPMVEIIERRNQLNSNTPGAISTVDAETLRNINPVTGSEVFRQISGVHIYEEDGMGLRANIGIRGLDPDKSRTVLVLEDGIPIALGPYGEPELYYTPAIEKMSSIEVLKGSGSILHGPRTIGGVVNYVTKDPTKTESFDLTLRGGMGGLFSTNAFYGNTYGKAGVALNVLHKRADNIGALDFALTDVSGKIKIQTSSRSVLGLKIGFYNETSNATYIGLTQSMYDADNQDFVRIAPNDLMAVRRYSASLTHDFFINEKSKLKTTAFAYTTTRNWRRQDFAYNNLDTLGNISNYPSNFTGVIWGDTTIQNGAILMRNQTGNRNRQFEVAGIQSNFMHDYQVAGAKNHLVVGARFMYERAFEQRINGTVTDLSYGVLRDAEVRTGFGTSVYAHNQTALTEKLNFTGGIRTEFIDYERSIQRTNHLDTLISNTTGTIGIIPGIGMSYVIKNSNALFAGIHRGFAPPRLKDAVSNTGEDVQLNAELSWNFELGARGKLTKGIVYEVALFHMDFENQIIPVSESAGGAGAGLVNAGATTHSGIEFTAQVNFHELLKMKGHKLNFTGNFTWVESVFSEDRFVGSSATNIKGNYTPYAPNYLSNAAVTYEHKSGFGLRIQSTFVGAQFADIANSVSPSANGRNGKIDAYQVFDATAMYHLKQINTTIMLSAKNLTDERAIITRRPQGIRVMNPRLITFSAQWTLK